MVVVDGEGPTSRTRYNVGRDRRPNKDKDRSIW